MKNKILKIVFLFFIILIGVWIARKFYSRVLEFNEKKASDYYKDDRYYGVVIKKFINREQHNFKTILLRNKMEDREVLYDFEIGGLYEFIRVGDSISKEPGTLDVYLKRIDFDTIVQMEVYDGSKSNE